MDYDLAVSLSIGVNVSSHQFSQPTLVERIKQILAATGLNSQDLTLEITENAIVEAKEASKVRLREIRDLGVKLAIDDFGTGYSSLSYLSNFPFNTLKIDRSFVDNMEVKRENRKIVQALVSLAQNIGMNVVAEGIETTEQTALLEKLQCQYGQGYLFSKPLDAKAIEEIFKNSPSSTFDKNLIKSYREYQTTSARASTTLVMRNPSIPLT
ncbi:MAG: EAL domain-containing protein [Prochloraceae cyanobacterium]|nr:EAL domain-containing protein [Prochloraceae cyanobacterium]